MRIVGESEDDVNVRCGGIIVSSCGGACRDRASDGEGGEVAQELPVREEGQAARRGDGRGGDASCYGGTQGQAVELQAAGAGREGRRDDPGGEAQRAGRGPRPVGDGHRVRSEEARRGGRGGDRGGRRRRGGRGARGSGGGAPVLSQGAPAGEPHRGRGGGQDPGQLQRLPGTRPQLRTARGRIWIM
jgi:hypothetical protein